MAKPAAKTDKASKQQGLPLGSQLVLAASFVPLCAVFLPTLVLLAPLMAPTIVALLFDRGEGRPLALTIGMLNFSGSLQGVGMLWARGHTFNDLGPVLGDPMAWMFAYAAAAMAWLVRMSIPPIISTYYKAASEARIRNLTIRQQKLLDTWGDELREAAAELTAGSPDPDARRGGGSPARAGPGMAKAGNG